MEESTLFPEIEKRSGEKGIMDVNVEQHRKSFVLYAFTLKRSMRHDFAWQCILSLHFPQMPSSPASKPTKPTSTSAGRTQQASQAHTSQK